MKKFSQQQVSDSSAIAEGTELIMSDGSRPMLSEASFSNNISKEIPDGVITKKYIDKIFSPVISVASTVFELSDSTSMRNKIKSISTQYLKVDLKSIKKSSDQVLKMYNAFLSDPNNKDKYNVQIETGPSLKTTFLNNAYNFKKDIVFVMDREKTRVEGEGISWERSDDAYFILQYCLPFISGYLRAIKMVIDSIQKISPSNPDPEKIASNKLALEILSDISTIDDLMSDSSVFSGNSKSSDLINLGFFDIRFPNATPAPNQTNTFSAIGTVEIEIPTIISNFNSIASNKRGERNIYIHKDALNLSAERTHRKNKPVSGNKKTVFSFTVNKNAFSSGQIIIEIFKQDGSRYDAGEYEINSNEATVEAKFSTSKKTASRRDGLAKEATMTQSTYYEISVGGKKIVTTLAEYIQRGGIYNNIKADLGNAKRLGINDVNKRNKKS